MCFRSRRTRRWGDVPWGGVVHWGCEDVPWGGVVQRGCEEGVREFVLMIAGCHALVLGSEPPHRAELCPLAHPHSLQQP